MPQMLTSLLTHAVPDVRVESASLVKTFRALWLWSYWISVEPNHYRYWQRFKEIYPHWKRVAFTYHARKDSLSSCGFCPEFAALEDLFGWLFEVLELTRGERRLLFLCEGCRGCRKF